MVLTLRLRKQAFGKLNEGVEYWTVCHGTSVPAGTAAKKSVAVIHLQGGEDVACEFVLPGNHMSGDEMG